jgi:hypothetical protein
MLRYLLPAILLGASAPLAAEPPQPGHWAVMTAGGTVMRIDLARGLDGWSATLLRPVHFSYGDEEFSGIQPETASLPASQVREAGGDLELTIPDPASGGNSSVFRFHQLDASHATLGIAGVPIEPFPLLLTETAAPIAPFDPQRSYAVATYRPTNGEMSGIFDADQADRADPAHIDWSKVDKADEARRARTQELLDGGQLQSAEDFYHAAFVFQHGSRPEDYLKAHLFALVAMARGKPSAKWIAAATLDRYLDSIGRKQVLGTKFRMVDGQPVMDPATLDPGLAPDSLRQALGVPPLAEQEEQMRRAMTPNAAK